jgi:hypothetical protein
MERLLDRLAQSGAQQKQLHEMVERLLRENEELREEINYGVCRHASGPHLRCEHESGPSFLSSLLQAM